MSRNSKSVRLHKPPYVETGESVGRSSVGRWVGRSRCRPPSLAGAAPGSAASRARGPARVPRLQLRRWQPQAVAPRTMVCCGTLRKSNLLDASFACKVCSLVRRGDGGRP